MKKSINNNLNEVLRNLPQVDEVLVSEKIKLVSASIPHDFLVNAIREVIVDVRANVINGISDTIDKDDIIDRVIQKVEKKSKPSLKRVINATGVVLHTNLGRAKISEASTNAMIEVAKNYSNLEYDLKRGERGDRQSHIEKIIKDLTGVEAAMVVNNNAAATIIVLAALAENKEVVISRGELIEIGGSFRIPEVMMQSKAILKEVGTTNKTKISDYKNAIVDNETALILKVHKSNYKIVGFTEEVPLNKLNELRDEYDIPVAYDMGNGLFVDLKKYGIDEPTVPSLIKDGADIVLFSGDKLLGGPQAGIIIGKEKYISKMKKHPLARAFRVDKFTLAALNATLFEYYDEKRAKMNIPILRMLTYTDDELKSKAEKLYKMLKEAINGIDVSIEQVHDQVGGGTAPDVLLPSYAVTMASKDVNIEKIERNLREMEIPIIVRVAHDKIYLGIRTIDEREYDIVVSDIKSAIND